MTNPYEGMKPEPWMADGSCVNAANPDDWFAEEERHGRGVSATTRSAIEVCGGCPIAEQCLQYALDAPELTGIWGGTTWQQRRYIRSKAAA